MAKVTDLNGCFVKVRSELEKGQIEVAVSKLKSRVLMNLVVDDFDYYGQIFFKNKPEQLHATFKEIYFHDGDFYDCPVTVIVDLASPYPHKREVLSQDRVTYPAGYKADDFINATEEDVLWRKFGSTVEFFANPDFEFDGIMSNWIDGDELFIVGYRQVWGKVMAVVQNIRTQNCSALTVDCLRKPETETEKKTRETAEEVNRICFDLFGTPAFDCNQDVIDTVEKMVINGYKKGE